MKGKDRKPHIFWLEGLLTKFNAPFPYDDADDPRRFGFSVGQQIVGLYLAEMLLKVRLGSFWCVARTAPQSARALQEPLPSTPARGGAKVHKDPEQHEGLGLGRRRDGRLPPVLLGRERHHGHPLLLGTEP